MLHHNIQQYIYIYIYIINLSNLGNARVIIEAVLVIEKITPIYTYNIIPWYTIY